MPVSRSTGVNPLRFAARAYPTGLAQPPPRETRDSEARTWGSNRELVQSQNDPAASPVHLLEDESRIDDVVQDQSEDSDVELAVRDR